MNWLVSTLDYATGYRPPHERWLTALQTRAANHHGPKRQRTLVSRLSGHHWQVTQVLLAILIDCLTLLSLLLDPTQPTSNLFGPYLNLPYPAYWSYPHTETALPTSKLPHIRQHVLTAYHCDRSS